jgi:sporulation-control protein
MFKSLFSKLGFGGAKVDTQITSSVIYPGGYLTGRTVVMGGTVEQEIDEIYLHFSTSAHRDGYYSTIEFYKVKISNRFIIGAHEEKQIPFNIPTPHELPITVVNGHHTMPNNGVYVRTAMDIAYAMDASDHDRFEIAPHPAMDSVLQAIEYLGFDLLKVDIEHGHLQGSNMPFFQEFEYRAYRTNYASRMNEIEISFIGRQNEVEVVLEIDKRSNFMGFGGGDMYRRFRIPYVGYERIDMVAQLDQAIRSAF